MKKGATPLSSSHEATMAALLTSAKGGGERVAGSLKSARRVSLFMAILLRLMMDVVELRDEYKVGICLARVFVFFCEGAMDRWMVVS